MGGSEEQPVPLREKEEKHPHHLLSGRRFQALVFTVILTALGYLLFALWGGWGQVAQGCLQVGTMGILTALILSLCNYSLRFVRWQYYLTVLGYPLPWIKSFRIYMAGFALTTTPGKAGEALRSIFLADYGMPYRKSFGAFLAERVADLMAILVLAAIGIWDHADARPVVFGSALFIALCLLAIQKKSWLKAIERFFQSILSEKLAHAAEFFVETIAAFRSCYRLPVLAAGSLLGIAAWGAEAAAFYNILYLLNAEIPFEAAVFIYAFSMLVGALTFLPGGLGGAEVAMVQLLLFYKMPASDAVAATLVIRLATLWFSVFLGLIALPKSIITLRR